MFYNLVKRTDMLCGAYLNVNDVPINTAESLKTIRYKLRSGGMDFVSEAFAVTGTKPLTVDISSSEWNAASAGDIQHETADNHTIHLNAISARCLYCRRYGKHIHRMTWFADINKIRIPSY